MADAAALRARLGHVYWIGGGSGGGKSTIARLLAARHGLRLYATDDAMADHGDRIEPGDAPFLRQFAAMDMNVIEVDTTMTEGDLAGRVAEAFGL